MHSQTVTGKGALVVLPLVDLALPVFVGPGAGTGSDEGERGSGPYRKMYCFSAEGILVFFPVAQFQGCGSVKLLQRPQGNDPRAVLTGCADSQTLVESEVGSVPKGTGPLF
jgi:hypothetical protein